MPNCHCAACCVSGSCTDLIWDCRCYPSFQLLHTHTHTARIYSTAANLIGSTSRKAFLQGAAPSAIEERCSKSSRGVLRFCAIILIDLLWNCCYDRRNPKGWFPKGWFWRMFPRNENRNKGTFGCSPGMKTGTKTGTRVRSHIPPKRKPDEGTFAKTTLLRNRPFISRWYETFQAQHEVQWRFWTWFFKCSNWSWRGYHQIARTSPARSPDLMQTCPYAQV